MKLLGLMSIAWVTVNDQFYFTKPYYCTTRSDELAANHKCRKKQVKRKRRKRFSWAAFSYLSLKVLDFYIHLRPSILSLRWNWRTGTATLLFDRRKLSSTLFWNEISTRYRTSFTTREKSNILVWLRRKVLGLVGYFKDSDNVFTARSNEGERLTTGCAWNDSNKQTSVREAIGLLTTASFFSLANGSRPYAQTRWHRSLNPVPLASNAHLKREPIAEQA